MTYASKRTRALALAVLKSAAQLGLEFRSVASLGADTVFHLERGAVTGRDAFATIANAAGVHVAELDHMTVAQARSAIEKRAK